jgi:hypothetical protein
MKELDIKVELAITTDRNQSTLNLVLGLIRIIVGFDGYWDEFFIWIFVPRLHMKTACHFEALLLLQYQSIYRSTESVNVKVLRFLDALLGDKT